MGSRDDPLWGDQGSATYRLLSAGHWKKYTIHTITALISWYYDIILVAISAYYLATSPLLTIRAIQGYSFTPVVSPPTTRLSSSFEDIFLLLSLFEIFIAPFSFFRHFTKVCILNWKSFSHQIISLQSRVFFSYSTRWKRLLMKRANQGIPNKLACGSKWVREAD